jgi:hypothetical protein
MAKNDELPPMGLPLNEPSSPKYFLGLVAMVLIVGGLVFAIAFGALQFTSGPCDELYANATDGLRAEVEFLKESGESLGVNKVEIQELRSSTQVAGDSLKACCQQQRDGLISAESFAQCERHASAMAALPAELVAAHGEATEAKTAIRKAANELRRLAGDLTDIASRGESGSGIAAGPLSDAGSGE